MDVVAEDRTNIGRIDAVLRSGEYIYVIECKLDKSAEKAIEQIEAKKYAEKFEIDKELDKKIIWIGMNFSYDDNIRNIESYRVEEIPLSSRWILWRYEWVADRFTDEDNVKAALMVYEEIAPVKP